MNGDALRRGRRKQVAVRQADNRFRRLSDIAGAGGIDEQVAPPPGPSQRRSPLSPSSTARNRRLWSRSAGAALGASMLAAGLGAAPRGAAFNAACDPEMPDESDTDPSCGAITHGHSGQQATGVRRCCLGGALRVCSAIRPGSAARGTRFYPSRKVISPAALRTGTKRRRDSGGRAARIAPRTRPNPVQRLRLVA